MQSRGKPKTCRICHVERRGSAARNKKHSAAVARPLQAEVVRRLRRLPTVRSLLKQRFYSLPKAVYELSSALPVVQIRDVAEVSQVKWNVGLRLGYQDHVTAERVRDPDFVEDIWISASAVAHNNA